MSFLGRLFRSAGGIRGGRGAAGLKAAVVQFEAVHEEVVPSVFAALSAAGVASHAYVSARVRDRRGDLLGGLAETSGKVSYPRIECAADWDALAETVIRSGADLLVLNTFQRESVARWSEGLGLPIIGLVHNPKLFLEQAPCAELVGAGRAAILTLAPHVSAWLAANGGGAFPAVGCISHTFWHLPRREGATGTRKIVIPGAVSYDARDFRSVLDSMPAIIGSAGTTGFEFLIVGGGPDRARFQDEVESSGHAAHFRFAPCNAETGYVDNESYFAALAEADFILPMLPEARADYRTFKITSAIPTSVGFGIPAIVDRWTASVYGLPCVEYGQGRMIEGLLAAVSMDGEELDRLRAELAAFRAAEQRRSAQAMERAVATVMPPRAASA
jgi:hypothetical protein